jgi:hypothetical protein
MWLTIAAGYFCLVLGLMLMVAKAPGDPITISHTDDPWPPIIDRDGSTVRPGPAVPKTSPVARMPSTIPRITSGR